MTNNSKLAFICTAFRSLSFTSLLHIMTVRLQNVFICQNYSFKTCFLARENSQRLAMLQLTAPPRNDIWEMSTEVQYWWRITTQICVVALIGCAAWEVRFNLNQYRIYALASQISFQKETSGGITKSQLFCRSTYFQLLQSQGDCKYYQW